jgi:hypothetical protein
MEEAVNLSSDRLLMMMMMMMMMMMIMMMTKQTFLGVRTIILAVPPRKIVWKTLI